MLNCLPGALRLKVSQQTVGFLRVDDKWKLCSQLLKVFGLGIFGLYAGDVNAKGQINLADVNTLTSAATTFAAG
jgi:hypothetical protein